VVALTFDVGAGGEVIVVTGRAHLPEDQPPANEVAEFPARYRRRMFGTPEGWAAQFPVPMRVHPLSARGHLHGGTPRRDETEAQETTSNAMTLSEYGRAGPPMNLDAPGRPVWGDNLVPTPGGRAMQKLIPCLWFDDQAEDAANFYISVVPNSRVLDLRRYGEAGPRPAGMVMTVRFDLNGQEFLALNGGPEFTFGEAISFQLMCESQEEVDDLWARLTDGGEEGPCGWLKDRFGVSWQVVPVGLDNVLAGPDPNRSAAAMRAMFQMKKLDMPALQEAYDRAS
jgi:predicted 3-demethylubiquinone-9 3-methyltransferase (glyoxalase superfamily)